jgi:hypothetical protein
LGNIAYSLLNSLQLAIKSPKLHLADDIWRFTIFTRYALIYEMRRQNGHSRTGKRTERRGFDFFEYSARWAGQRIAHSPFALPANRDKKRHLRINKVFAGQAQKLYKGD